MKKIVLIIIVLFAFLNGKAQNEFKCGFDEAYLSAKEKYPANFLQQEENKKKYELFLASYLANKKSKLPEKVYKIPVVIHMMHQYGSVYSDFINNRSKFKQAIDDINYHFRNEDSANIEPPFDLISPNLNIEFVLANLDPNGHPTEGLTLNYFPPSVTAAPNGEELKSIVQWDNHKYLNIWIVPSIPGNLGGYAHLPGTVPDNLDGIIMKNGTLAVGFLNGLAHECGHWLGLPHPWGAPPTNDISSNCSQDDNVSDTPNTQGQNRQCDERLRRITCTNDPSPYRDVSGTIIWPADSGQIHDNTQNTMDYAFCKYENFTEGQKVLVRGKLNTDPVRDSIWRETNLVATGICDTCGTYALFPKAEFMQDKAQACEGDGVQFTDISYNGTPTEWLWNFGDGSTDTAQNPLHIFHTPGVYDVTLKATNANGATTTTRVKAIAIAAISGGKVAPFYENFESGDFPNLDDPLKEWVVENGHTTASWEKIDGIYATGNSSFGLNLNEVLDEGTQAYRYHITSPTVDFSNPKCNKLYYKWAYAKRSSLSTDLLNVQVNKNCGEGTWTKVYSASAATMITSSTNTVQHKYEPKPSEFQEQEVNLASFTGRDHILIRFEIETGGGNFFYIDDINIGCDSATSISENKEFNLAIYPNPYDEYAVLDLNLNKSDVLSIIVTNILGEKLHESSQFYNIGKHSMKLNELIGLAKNGVYFVTVKSEHSFITKKVIKI